MTELNSSLRGERSRRKKMRRIASINIEIDGLADIPQNKVRLDVLYEERRRIGDRLGLLPVSYIWHGLGSPTPGSVLI